MQSPWLNAIAGDDLSNVGISLALDNVLDKAASERGIARAHLLIGFLVTAKTSRQESRRNGPSLDAVVFEHAMPFSAQYVSKYSAGQG